MQAPKGRTINKATRCDHHYPVLRRKISLTLNNVDDTQPKQRRYMIGSGCVNCNSATHAVSNNHDGRWVLSIERLHHFANIPFERKGKDKLLTLLLFSPVCPSFSAYSQKLLTGAELFTMCMCQCVILRLPLHTHSNLLGHRVCREIVRVFHFGVACRPGKETHVTLLSPSKILNKQSMSGQIT